MMPVRLSEFRAVLDLNPKMKFMSFAFLAGGWVIAVAALWLLHSPASRDLFLLAGVAVQALGLVFAVRSHRIPYMDRG
jgi:hypothetical protein